MRIARVPVTNFQFGEISPNLIARTDSNIYNASAQKVENFFIRGEGGLIKRAGLKNTYEFDTTVDTSKQQQVRIIPFIFSDDERYIVALEHQKIRVFILDFDSSGSVSAGAVSLCNNGTLTQDVDGTALTFLSDTILNEITYAQSGDVMFLAHQTFMVKKLVRTGLTTFTIDTFEFDSRSDNKQIYQPYYPFHPVAMTLDPSASSGNGITLTTSAAYFDTTGSSNGSEFPDSKHKNVYLRYHGQEIKIVSVQSSTSATGNVQDELFTILNTDALRTVEGSTTVYVTQALHGLSVGDALTFSQCGAVGGIAIGNLNGSRTVAAIISDNEYTITAGASATSSATGGGSPKVVTHAPTTDWEEQSYSSMRGFPAAVAFHENRLWFGGTLGQPDGLWGSQSGEFFNFNTGTALDNESIQLTSSIGEINTIKHIVSNRDLQVFTSTSEFSVPAFNQNPTTPTNAMIRRQTPFGISNVKPFVFDGATIYVQKEGSIVREFIYSDSEDAYVSTAVSALSAHLIKNPVQMTTLQAAIDRAESYVFVLNNDGTIAVFNSNRAEKRAGWSEFSTDSVGVFHSITTIDEKVFAVGRYNKGAGTNKLFLMQFDSSFNTDLAKTYSGTNGVFNVSSDFENGAVLEVIDGTNYVGSFTVSGGNIDVSDTDSSLSSAEIGFKFDINLKTNPIDVVAGNGPVTGRPRSIGRVVMDLSDTLSITVNSREFFPRDVTDDFSVARTAFTGKKEFKLLGYNKNPQVTISQNAPLQVQVNGLIAEVIF